MVRFTDRDRLALLRRRSRAVSPPYASTSCSSYSSEMLATASSDAINCSGRRRRPRNEWEKKMSRPSMLKRGRERAVANRHPWIFTGAIASESGPDDAAIADLVEESGKVLASGFHSKHSQIRLRALTFGNEELTADVIRERITRAIERR